MARQPRPADQPSAPRKQPEAEKPPEGFPPQPGTQESVDQGYEATAAEQAPETAKEDPAPAQVERYPSADKFAKREKAPPPPPLYFTALCEHQGRLYMARSDGAVFFKKGREIVRVPLTEARVDNAD